MFLRSFTCSKASAFAFCLPGWPKKRLTVHPDAGMMYWNWAAPFGIGWNTVNIDGMMSFTFASSLYTASQVQQVKQHTERLIRDVICG